MTGGMRELFPLSDGHSTCYLYYVRINFTKSTGLRVRIKFLAHYCDITITVFTVYRTLRVELWVIANP